jgi:3-deoxy-manno-octulosonate cytidylyltransferase (CMP-KDO synthetase)
VIPARLASTRLPRKLLLRETGKYLLEHVYGAVARARSLDAVWIATDSAEIAEAARSFGAGVELTRSDHRTGTDRVAEVVARWPSVELAVNVQGDEPELRSLDVDRLVDTLARSGADVATLAAPCPAELVGDPSTVKVVTDLAGRALYFSRSPIPHARFEGAAPLQHVGAYAFRREALDAFARLEPSPLERVEGLEQLRFLEHGRSIAVVTIERAPVGVDTPADYARFVAGELARARP